LQKPSSLIFVDQDYMRGLGYPESPLWEKEGTQLLSAPTEVHFALTRKCSVGCRMCYMDSSPDASNGGEIGREGAFAILAKLARMKVFHVALGGGESAELPWLFEAGHIARSLGLIPNLTTNGFSVTEDSAREYRVFGQVNVSIDGIGEHYEVHRKVPGFEKACRALELFKKHKIRHGINCIVSRRNYDHLEDVFALGARLGIRQLELLRLKPAGRAAGDPASFVNDDLSDEQAWDFFPRIMKLTKKYKTPLSIDCSLTPYLYCHDLDREKLDFFGVTGCFGGNVLIGVHPDGSVTPCSFADEEDGRSIHNIEEWWGSDRTFFAFRKWLEAAPEPCRSCKFLSLCRGGCHVVSRHVTGDIFMPDPGCPIVRRHLRPQS